MKNEIEELKEEIAELKEKIKYFEIDPDEIEEEFDYWLDDMYPEIFGHLASYILKEIDPIQYDELRNDYINSMEIEDYQPYKDLENELEDLENELEELENGE